MPEAQGTNDFLAKTKAKPPATFLTGWLPKLGLLGGIALDLGCGAGAEAAFLAESGFMVDAIDKSETAVKSAKERCTGLTVDVILGDFNEFELRPSYYMLAAAMNSLPFISKEQIRPLLKRVQESLKPGGVAVFSLFGPEHAWATERPDMNFWTVEEVRDFWREWEIVNLEEKKGPAPLSSGIEIMQHRIWLVARKPAA